MLRVPVTVKCFILRVCVCVCECVCVCACVFDVCSCVYDHNGVHARAHTCKINL